MNGQGFQGPSSGVAPGLRDPWGSYGGGFDPWSEFQQSDVMACYPAPRWILDRLQNNPQPAAGNDLHDPLPIPFTSEEARNALMDVWNGSHNPSPRACAPIYPASVHIALAVLAALQGRNGGWISFNASYLDPSRYNLGAATEGHNLRCLLNRLVGKPLPAALNPCSWAPPRAELLYRVPFLETTYDSFRPPAPEPPFGTAWHAPYGFVAPDVPPSGPGYFLPPGPFGLQLEAMEPPEPGFTAYRLFEVLETFDFREVG